ncbi:MAG: hypothetical protein Q4C84_11910 [Bacillota bacterium]|nr:hypothetical protein [Bacillota bacterium]
MELVTGYQEKHHFTVEQMADFNRGIYGKAAILPVGSRLEVEIQTANRITVKDGVAVFDGREVYIGYGKSEAVNLTSGTQGMKRNDIVVVEYKKENESGVESVALKVISGTPSSTTPVDPAVNDVDIRTGTTRSEKPFCRVRLNGTAIEGIDMLVEVKEFKKHTFANPVKTLTATEEGNSLDAIMGKELKKQIDAKCVSTTLGGYGKDWLLTGEWQPAGNYNGFEGETEYYKGVRGRDGYIEVKTSGVYLIALQASIQKKTYLENGTVWSKITKNDSDIGGDHHFLTDGTYYDTLNFVTYNYLSAGTRLKAYLSVDSSLTDVWSQGEEYLNIIKLS